MSLPRYRARDLAAMDKTALLAIPDGPIEVEFDPLPSGEPQILKTDSRLTYFSALNWGLYNEYPQTPAKISHHIGTDRLDVNTHMTLMNRVFWDCFDAYDGNVDIEHLCELAYDGTNRYFNEVTLELESEVPTLSIEHLVEVVEEPQIKAAIDAIDGSSASIDLAHVTALKQLRDPTAIPGNPISIAIRGNTVSPDQILQTLIARGRVGDIDSTFFREAVPSSFLSGMNSLYESMTESCTMKKAAAYKEKPIEDSEYFNRRLQLMAATVDKLEEVLNDNVPGLKVMPGDCGTTRTLRWKVKPKDLKALEGKYYRDPASPTGYTSVKENDQVLVGQTIEIRSPTLCMHPHPQSICTVCYGELALSLPRGTTMGHVAAVDYGERVTQNMLGIKHVDFAGKEKPLVLLSFEKEWLEVIPSTRTIRFNAKAKGKRLTLSMDPAEVESLAELQYVESADMLPTSRVTEIDAFYLTVEDTKGDKDTYPLHASVEGKKAHFTHDLLEHIRTHAYRLSDTGRYLIDLEGFDLSLPIFEIPNQDVNILDYLKSIVQFITSTEDSTKKKDDRSPKKMLKHARTIEEAVMAFLELTQVRMTVNLVHLEILIYSTMVRDPKHLDYRMPYQGNALVFEQLSRVIQSRSLGAALAFEGQSRLLRDPATFLNPFRSEHILDDLLVPKKAKW